MARTVAELVAAREAKGLGTSDIASQLKLAVRQVAALERGDWAGLPGLAFVRGALRAYGRVVDIKVDALLATLDDGTQGAELRPSTPLEAPMPSTSMLGFGSGGTGSKTAWLILGTVLLLALALFFGRDTDFSTIPSLLPGTQAVPAPTGGPNAVAQRPGIEQIATLPQSQAPAPEPGTSAQAGTTAAPGPAGPAVPAAVTPAAPAAAPIPVAPPERLVPAVGAASSVRLQFDRESWVEIKQADGRVLLYGQQKAGSEARLPFATEISLRIGNADHVRLEHNGMAVDIKQIARQGVARLKLNP